MVKSSLDAAQDLLKQRKFRRAIRFLENCEEEYEGVAEYYVTAGVCYLYADIEGKAAEMFRKARGITIQNVNLLLGQAVIFLKRNEVARAVEYYLQVIEIDPHNKVADNALEFIRGFTNDGSGYGSIAKMMETGEIKKFYPPLGFNPNVARNCILIGFILGLLCSAAVLMAPKIQAFSARQKTVKNSIEKNFSLSEDELRNAVQLNAEEGEFSLSLTTREIQQAFSSAKKYFVSSRDNLCRHELNRILCSNASIHIKRKAQSVADLLQEPTFDTLKDNFKYSEVAENPVLYLDCYAVWDGMVTNSVSGDDGSWKCDLLVDYIPSENRNFQVGLVHVVFEKAPEPSVDQSKPVRFLGKISKSGSDIVLSGKAVYQQLKGTKLVP